MSLFIHGVSFYRTLFFSKRGMFIQYGTKLSTPYFIGTISITEFLKGRFANFHCSNHSKNHLNSFSSDFLNKQTYDKQWEIFAFPRSRLSCSDHSCLMEWHHKKWSFYDLRSIKHQSEWQMFVLLALVFQQVVLNRIPLPSWTIALFGKREAV